MGAVRRSTGTTFCVLCRLLRSIKGRTTGSDDNNNNNNNNNNDNKLLYNTVHTLNNFGYLLYVAIMLHSVVLYFMMV